MANIKLIYIDKDNWDEEVNLFYMRNELNTNTTHEFISYNNIVSLDANPKYTTICTKKNLNSNIKRNMTSAYNTSVLVGFELNLEYIFSTLIDIAKTKNIDIYILDKSKYSIRNNVSMTIDLNEYDTTTDFNSVKGILEANLNDSLENARKSKKPTHAKDLGITLEEEESKGILDMIINSFGLEGYVDEYIDEDDEDIDSQIDMWLNELEKEEAKLDIMDEISSSFNSDFSVKRSKDNLFEISDNKSSVTLDKTTTKKMIKILEVLLDDE